MSYFYSSIGISYKFFYKAIQLSNKYVKPYRNTKHNWNTQDQLI